MRKVIMEKCHGERGYSVHYGTECDGTHARVFLWGQFDDGDVSWQQARKQARDYAKKLEAQLSK
jgi:hypothetical protein